MPMQSDGESRPTIAGCLLMILSLGVIAGVALPVVRLTRSFPSSKEVTIVIAAIPILAGALVYAIGVAILKFIGLSDVAPPKTESPEPHEDRDGLLRNRQDPG
jgi:hypothetical protein